MQKMYFYAVYVKMGQPFRRFKHHFRCFSRKTVYNVNANIDIPLPQLFISLKKIGVGVTAVYSPCSFIVNGL